MIGLQPAVSSLSCPRRLARVWGAAILTLAAGHAALADDFRPIGEVSVFLRGVSAVVDPADPVVPKNTPAGVRLVVRAGSQLLSAAEVERFMGGPFRVEAELAGPGLREPLSLPVAGAENAGDRLLLSLPPLTVSGNYDLSNLRLTVDGRTILDASPPRVTVKVVEQILVTSVKTRPLTLEEIRDRGIVIDSSAFLGFEFNLGLQLESQAVNMTFPVVFDQRGAVLPQPLVPPVAPGRSQAPLPTIVPMLLQPAAGPTPTVRLPDGREVEVRIPSVLVIPGNVGFLKQFFSAQLFVANGAPGGSGLTLHDVTGTVRLPPGPDLVPGTTDDPLSLPDTVKGPQPATLPVRGPGLDGEPGTADDVGALAPGEQGQAEFVLRGELEGFHKLDLDVSAILEGLATGPVTLAGKASGGVLVRNAFFDVSFTVPATVRRGEPFKAFVTVQNISASLGNAVTVSLVASRLSGARIVGEAARTIDTLAPRDAKTLEFDFVSDRTGQVVASYLRFDTEGGSTGDLRFTLGVGERGVPLSPDTLVLPTAVDTLPGSVLEAALRVLGQAWSVANAPAGALPAGVVRTSKTVVTEKALALAESGLRVGLGQAEADAVRDLVFDFHGASFDAGFDQVLRETEAGRDFDRVVGGFLASSAAGGAVDYERDVAQILVSGTDVFTFAVAPTASGSGLTLELVDAGGRRSRLDPASGVFVPSAVPGAALLPLGPGPGPALGLVPQPTGGETLEIRAGAPTALDLSLTLPRGDGTSRRGVLRGTLAPGTAYRVSADPTRATLALEGDADGDGIFETQQVLAEETLVPQGPRFLSATVIGPETLSGASPFGFHTAFLFDRVVGGDSAATVTRYTMPDNAVLSAKRQLSGRVVFATLARPEGPYVPSSVSVRDVADARGAPGPAESRTLASRLQDPGAVVSGRVLNADGTSVVSAVVTYAQNPVLGCEPPLDEYAGLAAVPVAADGRYELRYVRQDACGMPFKLATRDPQTGAVREVLSSVRTAGEQILLDIALFGKGAVAGTVRELAGRPVAGAQVVVLSETDPQQGGLALTDFDGRYRVEGVAVGTVRVTAVHGASLGRGSGRLDRAGTTAVVDVTLDGGTVGVRGTVLRVAQGTTTPVPALQVVYSAKDGGEFVPVAVTTSASDGSYAFTGMPTGEFRVSAALNTRDRGEVTGVAAAGDQLTGRDVLIVVQGDGLARVRGVVRLPDTSAAPGVVVAIDDRGTLTGDDGAFEIPDVPVRPLVAQVIEARSRDGLRRGRATVVVNEPLVEGVVVILSGLGAAEFTVLDAAGNSVPDQEVALLGDCPNPCGCAAAKTGADGHVRFEGLPVGTVQGRATRSAPRFIDQASAVVSIPRDGVTAFGVLSFPGVGIVTGTVLGPDGQPALGADVSLVSKVFDEDLCALVPGISHRVRSDEAGRFRFSDVNVGPVRLTVTHPFFPTAVGATGTLTRNGEQADFTLRLVDTISGELTGTVLLPDGTTPAGAGVEVTANGPLPDVTVTTDAAGAFGFAKVFPQGTYTVTARDPATGGVAQEVIFLRAGQDSRHDLRLKGRGTVRVRVVDGAGNAVASAFVRLQESDFPGRLHEGAADASNQGVVVFENVFEGRLSAEAFDAFGRGGRASSVLPGPGATVDLAVSLTATGTVRGHFRRPDGVTPVPFGIVKLLAGERTLGQRTTEGTGDVGAFAFDFVPAGPVRVEAQDPLTARTGFAVGTLEREGQELSLDVVAQGLGTVQGLVTSNGAAQAGAHVDVVSGSYRACTFADAAGRYLVEGVPEGRVVVTASLGSDFLAGTASATLAGDGTVLALDVALRAAGSVSGEVLRSDGRTPAPLSVVAIQVGGAGGGTLATTTNSEGRFAFDRVPAGLASLAAEVAGGVDRGAAAVEVLAGPAVAATIVLNGVGSLNGLALDSAGHPTAGDVLLRGTGAFPFTLGLTVGADGRFFLKEVLAGPVTATLTARSGDFALYGTASGTVAPDAATDLTVQVQPSGTVTGLVLRPDGAAPARGTTVTVDLGSGRGAVSLPVGDAGRFTAVGVPLGPFILRLFDPLTTGAGRVDGFRVDDNGQTVDVGTIVLDDTPVAVVSVAPADGAGGVPVTGPVVVTFSDPLASAAGVSLQRGPAAVPATAALSTDGRTVTLQGALPDSAEITVTASTAVTDVFGRHPAAAFTSRFRTVDLTPPKVLATAPADDAIEVGASASALVTFDEPLAASVDGAALVVVSGPAGAVPGTVARESATAFRFTPTAPLAENAVYSVTVMGAEDLSGNRQTTPTTIRFATHDTVPPILTLQQPANGAWVTSARPLIAVTAADATSGLAMATATLALDGTAVAAGLGPNFLSFIPPSELGEGQHLVQASVADRAGNRGNLGAGFRVDTIVPGPATMAGIADGDTIRGVVSVSASASDVGSGVARIEVLSDGAVVATFLPPAFAAPIDTRGLAEGTHTLAARAADVAGNVGPAGPPLHVVVDNRPLTVSIDAPAAGQRFRDAVTVRASVSEAVARVEFTLAGQTAVDSTAPYEATFDLASAPEGTVVIGVTAFGPAGEVANAARDVVVDRTPPAPPDPNRVTAEPPSLGRSLVFGRPGAVEASAQVEIMNTANGATADVHAGADGRFAIFIDASVDNPIVLVAVDSVGNRSTPTTITVRRTASLPPPQGATALRYEGLLADRVGLGIGAVSPDGSLDGVFTFSLSVGDGVTRQLSFIDLSGPVLRSTRPVAPVLGAAADLGSPLLNGPGGDLSLAVTGGTTLALFAGDGGFIQEGATYTVTAVFADGSQFVASVHIPEAADRAQVVHSARIAAAPATVTVAAGSPGTAVLTITDVRDVDGTLVPDGARIAVAAADMASRDPQGSPIRSAGGVILDGEPAGNNASFRVFAITGGTVTATYSSGTLTPADLFGALAVAQVQAADAAGNVIGTEAIATVDLNVKAASDAAIVHPTPASLYADGRDVRSRIVVRVRDGAGNPVPDGTRIALSAAFCASRRADNSCIDSAGGLILGGTASGGYRMFATSSGAIEAEYSASGLIVGTGQVRSATVQVLPADAAGNITSNRPLGLGSVQIVGAGSAELSVSPEALPYVFPTSPPAQVLVHHLHDTRANLAPDGTNVLLSAAFCASRLSNGTCVISAGGTIVDGVASPNGGYRVFALALGEARATYSTQGVSPTSSGQVNTATVQAVMGDSSGRVTDTRRIGQATVSVVGPLAALGSAQPATIFGDGGIHRATVTFTDVLDTFGNPLPEGTKVLASAAFCAARNAAGSCLLSAGGQVVNGDPSPNGGYRVFTIQDGTVNVEYADQNVTAAPGEIKQANVFLVQAGASGELLSSRALGAVPVAIAGNTSAQGSASPAAVHADGGDHRSVVTFTGFRDAAGNPVPDGTQVALTAAFCGSRQASGACIISAGGVVLGGAPSALGASYRLFAIANGQVVAEYSAQGVSVAQGEALATVQVVSVTSSGDRISDRALATASVRLLAPATATVLITPVDLAATGVPQMAQVTVRDLRDSDGATPVPDGSRVGLTAAFCAARDASGACVVSAGGAIAAAGTTPGDGDVAPNNPSFRLFTLAGGEVLAVYSGDGVIASVGETRTASVAVVPASVSGTILSTTALGVGTVRLHGTTSATASGPATVPLSGGVATVTFAGIKDAAGNTVPDGTLVAVTVGSCVTRDFTSGACNFSVGGQVVDGSAASDARFRLFAVAGGRVAVTYATDGASGPGIARIQMTAASPDGSVPSTRALAGGVWAITLTN